MSAAITDQRLSGVLSQYPLANPSVVGPMEASKRNDNFLVEDATRSRYVLRRHRRNVGERRVEFQLRFQEQLHRRGFPTSEVVETTSGNLFVTGEGGLWALFTYIEGSEFDFARMAQVAEAGRRLAEFHTATDCIELEEVVIDTNPHVRRWWTQGEQELAELEEMFRGQGVEEELALVRDWRAELLRGWPLATLDALPAGWVHSDYHGRNMVFVDDELRGLFDFDAVHRGFRVEDVGHALFMFGREFRGSRRLRPEVARVFLDEYDRNRPLRKEEREALPAMVVLAWAPSAPYYAMLQRDGEDPVAFFRLHVSLMRDLRAEMERLGPILTEG